MSTRGETLRLATRGSDLARWQAQTVKEQLALRRRPVELVTVETEGDQIRDELIHELGTTGAFVRSLDEKVLSGDLDGAVHSMKDMPTDQPEEMVVAAVLERGPVNDVLVTPDGTSFEDLSSSATIGTSSLRRKAQLLAERPELTVEGLRGNVDTRVEKLLAPTLNSEHERRVAAERDDEYDSDKYEQTPAEWRESLSELEASALERTFDTEYDAICLAEAGLARSDLLAEIEYERLDESTFVPAPAQGTIAVTALDGEIAEHINDTIDHNPTRVETTVERTILAELGGGCVAPVGIHARLQGSVVTTTVRVLSQDGSEDIFESRELSVQRHAREARDFAEDLADEGAADLIADARRDEPDGPKR
jgi:hydroxymethylbilane synthase